MVPTIFHLSQFQGFGGRFDELPQVKGLRQNSLDLKLDSRCQAHDIYEISFFEEDLMDRLST
jgi:hypothetical protein